MSQADIPMEQVPLKSDTDKPATDADNNESSQAESKCVATKTESGEPEQTPEKTPSKARTGFGRFFQREKKEKIVEGKEEGAEATEGEEGNQEETAEIIPKEPKKPIWSTMFQKKPKVPKEPKEGEEERKPSFGINLIDRDEHNLNEHIKLNFEDILAEPDTNHSWDCSWRLTNRIFTCTRCFIYKLFALIFAIPCAIIWGIVFALLAVLNIWACVPFGRALTIPAIWIAKAWNFFIRSFFDPIFRSCGLCCASVNVRQYGISNDHTVEMA